MQAAGAATQVMPQTSAPAAPAGQYGASASPQGNGYGQAFMQQYGQPPGQMRDQWQAFRQQNNIGQPAAPATPQMGQGQDFRSMIQAWLAQRPQMGGQMQDPRMMMQNWIGQRPQIGGLLGQ